VQAIRLQPEREHALAIMVGSAPGDVTGEDTPETYDRNPSRGKPRLDDST